MYVCGSCIRSSKYIWQIWVFGTARESPREYALVNRERRREPRDHIKTTAAKIEIRQDKACILRKSVRVLRGWEASREGCCELWAAATWLEDKAHARCLEWVFLHEPTVPESSLRRVLFCAAYMTVGRTGIDTRYTPSTRAGVKFSLCKHVLHSMKNALLLTAHIISRFWFFNHCRLLIWNVVRIILHVLPLLPSTFSRFSLFLSLSLSLSAISSFPIQYACARANGN